MKTNYNEGRPSNNGNRIRVPQEAQEQHSTPKKVRFDSETREPSIHTGSPIHHDNSRIADPEMGHENSHEQSFLSQGRASERTGRNLNPILNVPPSSSLH